MINIVEGAKLHSMLFEVEAVTLDSLVKQLLQLSPLFAYMYLSHLYSV